MRAAIGAGRPREEGCRRAPQIPSAWRSQATRAPGQGASRGATRAPRCTRRAPPATTAMLAAGAGRGPAQRAGAESGEPSDGHLQGVESGAPADRPPRGGEAARGSALREYGIEFEVSWAGGRGFARSALSFLCRPCSSCPASGLLPLAAESGTSARAAGSEEARRRSASFDTRGSSGAGAGELPGGFGWCLHGSPSHFSPDTTARTFVFHPLRALVNGLDWSRRGARRRSRARSPSRNIHLEEGELFQAQGLFEALDQPPRAALPSGPLSGDRLVFMSSMGSGGGRWCV